MGKEITWWWGGGERQRILKYQSIRLQQRQARYQNKKIDFKCLEKISLFAFSRFPESLEPNSSRLVCAEWRKMAFKFTINNILISFHLPFLGTFLVFSRYFEY